MRVVGNQNRDEFELNPVEALKRGAKIDAQMALIRVPHPRGVWRGTHAFFNAMDDKRSAEMGRRVKNAPRVYPEA
jgi:hypothetical protein